MTRIIFNRNTGILTCGDLRVRLSRKPAQLFLSIARRGTDGVDNDTIFREVWGADDDAPDTKIIDVLICTMRATLRDAGLPSLIETMHGVGRKLSEPVTIVPSGDDSITIQPETARLLRELIARAADRPADALLAERVRQAVFHG